MRAALLALPLCALVVGCPAEPKAPETPASAPAPKAAKPAPADTPKPAETPDRAPAAKRAPFVFTPEQRARFDKGPLFNIQAFEGTWVRLTETEGRWVIEKHCDAGAPTVTVEMNPEQPQIRVFSGQEADLISFDYALALGPTEAVVLDRVETEYFEQIRFARTKDGAHVEITMGDRTHRYVADAKKGHVEVVEPTCEAP